MNLSDIEWSTNSITKYQYLKQINESFLETFNVCNLEQIVEFPTRGFNIHEIVATNKPNLVSKCEPIPGLSDHDTAVLVDLHCHAKKLKPKKGKIFAWNKVDSNNSNHASSAVNKFLKSYTLDTPTNQLWVGIKNIVNSSMNMMTTRYTSTRYSQPWVTRECKRISKMKQRAFNRAKRTKQQTDWEYYRSLVTKSRQTCSLAYNQYINDCISPNIKYNPNPKDSLPLSKVKGATT